MNPINLARPASKRVKRLAERVTRLGWSAGGQLEVEQELVQGGELVHLLQDALHRPVGLGADTLSEDGADLESGKRGLTQLLNPRRGCKK